MQRGSATRRHEKSRKHRNTDADGDVAPGRLRSVAGPIDRVDPGDRAKTSLSMGSDLPGARASNAGNKLIVRRDRGWNSSKSGLGGFRPLPISNPVLCPLSYRRIATRPEDRVTGASYGPMSTNSAIRRQMGTPFGRKNLSDLLHSVRSFPSRRFHNSRARSCGDGSGGCGRQSRCPLTRGTGPGLLASADDATSIPPRSRRRTASSRRADGFPGSHGPTAMIGTRG